MATVARLVEDRGFGFINLDDGATEVFFHVTQSWIRRPDFGGISAGDKVLCQLGARERQPDKRAALKWAPVTDWDWGPQGAADSQRALDEMRLKVLRNLDPRSLDRAVAAKWYKDQWNGSPPSDLSDPVLRQAWLARLAEIPAAELDAFDLPAQLEASPFEFAAQLLPDDPACAVSTLLSTFAPAQLARLGVPDLAWLAPNWREPTKGAERLQDEQKANLLEWFWEAHGREFKEEMASALAGSEGWEALFARRLIARAAVLPVRQFPWLRRLADAGLLRTEDLDARSSRDAVFAAHFFSLLPQVRQSALRTTWRSDAAALAQALTAEPALISELLLSGTLSVDLETDGEKVWEIGCAGGNGCERLFDAASSHSLAEGFDALSARLARAELVVGHNILEWDAPILTSHAPDLVMPPAWDTLLVQFLLNPQADTHALGSNHHAETDAQAALDLFSEQLARFGPQLHSELVQGALRSSEALIGALVVNLPEGLSMARPVPAFLDAASPWAAVLMPPEEMHAVDWAPGVRIAPVDAGEALELSWRQIDPDRLHDALSEDQRKAPSAQVLLSVCRRAARQRISVRRNMIPQWLTERSPWLSAALDAAAVLPMDGGAVHVAPLPRSPQWWADVKTKRLSAVLPDAGPLVINRRGLGGQELLQLSAPANATLLELPSEGASRWVLRDQAARVLEVGGGWRGFDVVALPGSFRIIERRSDPSEMRPRLAVRQFTAIFTGSQAQSGYWMGQLSALWTLREDGIVPVFLVTSTTSRALVDMLVTACTEAGMAEIRPAHRSRREHLRRAAKRGHVIVDGIESWRDWQAIAEGAGVDLQPVIEACPLEEWHAVTEAESEAAGPGADDAPRVVSNIEMLEAAPKRFGVRLGNWLRQTGLSDCDNRPILLDPRLEARAYELRDHLDRMPVSLASWPADVRARLEDVFSVFEVKREEAPSDFAAMERFLVQHWQPAGGAGGNQITGFKPTQAGAMEHIRTRAEDVMVTLPTGEGKSVLFQVPALCRGLRNRRLTLVISPLKALMRDQMMRLHEQGFAESVDHLSSDQTSSEQSVVLQGLLENRIVLLYVAPERLRNANFVDVLRRRIETDGGLEHVVFDEAHCINQWGYEFRPDYFFAFSFLLLLLRDGTLRDQTPFLLLSATLTASDRRRIKGILERNAKGDAVLPLAVHPDPARQASPLRTHITVAPQAMQYNIFDRQDNRPAWEERLPEILNVIARARANTKATGQRSAVIIFVSRRAHADDLARELTQKAGCDVESYHAGLDGPTREEIYTRFREGEVDVLVATKAFGMGMDIPDIHWVVHLAPPTYLEDYLQEVGRIGRGVVERRRAGLDKLDAVMLASPQDFESIREMRAGAELSVPQINRTEEQILANSEVIDSQRVAIVPAHGFNPYKSPSDRRFQATQMRLSLYWLEAAGHLTQMGMVADLLTVTLQSARLAELAAEPSLQGRVATAILEATRDAPDMGGAPEGLFGRLQEAVGLRVRVSEGSKGASGSNTAILNLSQLRRRCGIGTLDETMSMVVALAGLRALELPWTLEFAKRLLFLEKRERLDALMKMVSHAVGLLLSSLERAGEHQFNPHDWFDVKPLDLPDPEGTNSRSEREGVVKLHRWFERAFVNGFRTLARASGVKLRQELHPQTEQVVWLARLAQSRNASARMACDALMAQAPSLLEIFRSSNDQKSIEVETLIRRLEAAHPRKTFRRADLESLLRLLSSLSLVSALPDLVPLSFFLVLREGQPGLDRHPELVEELNSVNAFAEARVFAMELFANLPPEARERFIPGYFAKDGVEELKGFLEAQLGEIAVEGADGALIERRDQLRATKVGEFFEIYKNSREPAQWAAMSHPYNQHLLVNAGPGAGKTSVLVGRIVHLIREQGVKPSEIIVLAFNRAVVFEIRRRIRDLFSSLGYGAYASRVRVSTFHALAMRSLHHDAALSKEALTENLLQEFAERLSRDEGFRREVVGDCRSILIDEFQDVTEDVYAIIRRLHEGSGAQAGVMAIGDDDQDILRWQRNTAQGPRSFGGSGFASLRPAGGFGSRPAKFQSFEKEDGAFAEIYFQRFRDDFGREDLATLELGVNFRSGVQVVETSQAMIKGFFDRTDVSKRLKTSLLRAAPNAPESICERVVSRDWSWDQVVGNVRESGLRLLAENPGSIAFLCRSNDEVASVHRQLAGAFPGLAVQSSENISISALRHVALWLDFLEAEAARQDQALTEPLRARLLESFQMEADIPEMRGGLVPAEVQLATLWDLCTQETAYPHISALIQFLRALRSDDLQRFLGASKGADAAVVSTIHKVKGLEYDTVVVLPSRTRFGQQANKIKADAAEEARLLYVALTRAKTRLTYYVGDRETAWGHSEPKPFQGAQEQGLILTGTPKQVAISWAMCRSSYNADPDAVQAYIETEVAVGDRLEVGGRSSRELLHRTSSGGLRQIGFIANAFGSGGRSSDLRVSAVMRYSADEKERDRQAAAVAARGWGYVVLVEGVLR